MPTWLSSRVVDVDKMITGVSVALALGVIVGYTIGFRNAQPTCSGYATLGIFAVFIAVVAGVVLIPRYLRRYLRVPYLPSPASLWKRLLKPVEGRVVGLTKALVGLGVAFVLSGGISYVIGRQTAQLVCDALYALGIVVLIGGVFLAAWLYYRPRRTPRRPRR